MELEYKLDFAQARERWDRFWRGECGDRPNVAITCPRAGRDPVEKPHPYEIHEIGVEAYADRIEEWANSLEFLGEAMPFCQLSYGADHLALLMGADLTLSGDMGTGKARSAWTHRFLDNYDMDIALRPESKWYERTFEDLAYLRRRFDGRLLLTSSEFSGGLDTLSAIRGNEQLLTDVLLQPDDAHRLLERVDALQKEALALIAKACGWDTWGSITRHGNYAKCLTSVPQCDFGFMIGTDLFDAFEIPSLARECEQYDGVVYHLDGPGSIKHLDSIAKVARVKVIQWVPGAGEAQTQDWTDLFDRVDELGLGNFLGGSPDRIRDLAKRYRSPYGYYRTGTKTRDEAERLMDDFADEAANDLDSDGAV